MDDATRQKIEKRAYELFIERGGIHGYHLEDWNKAEKQVMGKKPAATVPPPSQPGKKINK
jgi:hypothetical protein